MSDAVALPVCELLYLLPNEVIVDSKYSPRVWKSERGEEREENAVIELANTIDRNGQLDTAIVIPQIPQIPQKEGDKEDYILIAGHRRRRAIAILNEARSARNEPPLRLRVMVDRSGDDPFQKAIVSNLHRKNHSPMEIAALVRKVREENNWVGFPGAKKVAKYLGINVATVTQHEKLLGADPLIQEKLDAGEISAQSAFELMAAVPKERTAEVLQEAAEIQDDQIIESAIEDVKNGKLSAEAGAAKIKKAKKRIEHPAVRKAIKQSQGLSPKESDAKLPPTRREIVEFFEQLDGPANGNPDGAVRIFARYFVDKWAKGEGSERTLQEKFDAMTEHAPRGKATSAREEKAADVKKGKKK